MNQISGRFSGCARNIFASLAFKSKREHLRKYHTHGKKVGTTQNFFLAFIDELEKPIIIKKLLKRPIKNKIILIFTMLHFFLNIKKNTCRYHYKNLNDGL